MLNAEHPRLILAPNSIRQSRPLFIVAGALAGRIARLLSLPVPYFWGYFGLNIILLNLSLVVFLGAARDAGIDGRMALAAAPLLAWNIITKNFLWYPHQQLFAILTPTFTVWLLARALRRPSPVSLPTWGGWGAITGVLSLAYGNFFPLALCLLAVIVIRARREGWLSPAGLAPPALAVLLASVLPTLIWVAIATAKTGSYYNHEVAQYRQFVWLLDRASLGPSALARGLLDNTVLFLRTLVQPDVALMSLLALAGLVIVLAERRPVRQRRNTDDNFTAMLLTFCVFIGFFWLLGFYKSRLTFTIAPAGILIFLTGLNGVVSRRPSLRLPLTIGLGGVVAGWVFWQVFS